MHNEVILAALTYTCHALVLKRIKLGESDVICTLLCSDGSQLRAVAKGARKPTSAFSSLLELFSVCDLLLAKGKNLDIIKEARLISAHMQVKTDISMLEAASPILEFLEKTTQVDLPVPRIYDLTNKALTSFSRVEEDNLKITVAFLLKALAFLGFKPSFSSCVLCGEQVSTNTVTPISFSSLEGGVVCENCLRFTQTVFFSSELIHWLEVLLYSSFEEVIEYALTNAFSLELLRILSDLITAHMGISLKSLRFLFSHPF